MKQTWVFNHECQEGARTEKNRVFQTKPPIIFIQPYSFCPNMPYGIAPNEKGEWIAFNREYMPLGYNTSNDRKAVTEYKESPVYSKFKGLTENFLEKILDEHSLIQKDKDGNIMHVFFYNDKTNPSNPGNSKLWDRYFNILKKFAVLEVRH